MTETMKVIKTARDLVAQGWSKYAPARDKHRHATNLFGARVEAVSLDGAVKLALFSLPLKNRPRTERSVLKKLKSVVQEDVSFWVSEGHGPYDCLEAYNDSVAKTRKNVLQVFDAVLEEAAK